MKFSKQITRRRFLDQTFKFGATTLITSYGVSLCTCDRSESLRWQIGCYTRPWDNYDYRIALDAIAEAGYKYVGLMTTKSKTRLVISVLTTPEEAQKIGDEVKKRDLRVLSVYGGQIPVEESLNAGIDGIKRLIDNCAACEGTNLLISGTAKQELYDVYYKAVAEFCDYAAEKGIGISLKPHGGLNATGPQCRKIIEMIDHRNFRIWYDPGNIFYYSIGKLDPSDDAATVAGLVVGMCVKDYLFPKNVWVTPGTGMVDFPAVLACLKTGGFTGGPLIVECVKRGDLKQILEEAKKARQFLKELTAQSTTSRKNEQLIH